MSSLYVRLLWYDCLMLLTIRSIPIAQHWIENGKLLGGKMLISGLQVTVGFFVVGETSMLC